MKTQQEKAIEALNEYFEVASGHSCSQCPPPSAEQLSAAIKAMNIIEALTTPPAMPVRWEDLHAEIRKAQDKYKAKNGTVMGFNHWIYLANKYPNGLRIVKGEKK